MNEPNQYALHIDGKLFRRQRELLMRLAALVHGKQTYNPKPGDEELLEGCYHSRMRSPIRPTIAWHRLSAG